MFKFVRGAILLGLMIGAAQAGMPKSIDVLYIKAPFNLQNIVMKKQGLLEKEFTDDKVNINWIPLIQGGKQGQALASNSAQVTPVINFSSLILANANDNPIRVISGAARPSDLFGLVTLNGKIPEKGKDVVVAGPKGTALHQLLADYLSKKEMQENDVQFVGMSQQAALTALLAGRVDCALLSGALLERAREAGAKEIANAKEFTGVNLVVGVSKDFADKYPEAVKKIVKVQRNALEWIVKNREAAIEMGASELGISKQLARKLADSYHYYSVVSPEDLAQLDKTQRFLKEYGFIEKTVPTEKIVLPIAKKE